MKLLNLYISTFSLLGQSSLDTSVYLEQIRHLENKDETVLPVELTGEQKALYRALLEKNVAVLAAKVAETAETAETAANDDGETPVFAS